MKDKTTEDLIVMKQSTLNHINNNSKKIEELETKKSVIDNMIEEMYPHTPLSDEEKNLPAQIINRYKNKIFMLELDIKNTEKELMFISDKEGDKFEVRREVLMKRLSTLLHQQMKHRKSLLKYNLKGVEIMDKHINKENEEPEKETNFFSKLLSLMNKNVDKLNKTDLETSK